MHWILWVLLGLTIWTSLSFGMALVWGTAVRRRERYLMSQGLMVETSYYPAPEEETAIARARQLLGS